MQQGSELVPVLERHRFDEAALGAWLRDRLPGFDGPVTVRQFQGGQSNPTFHVATRAGDHVLRKKPPGKLLPGAHAVEREYRVIAALAGSAVPVPPARLLCEDAAVIGTPFFVMDAVEGRVLPDRVAQVGTPGEKRAIYAEMARVMAALHGVDWRGAGLEGFGKPDGYMARQTALWTRQWEAARAMDLPAMDALARWLPEHLPQDAEATIAHGDFRLGNMMLAPDAPRIVAVLDWELSTIGHPLADLAYCCVTYRLPPEQGGLHGVDFAESGIPTEAEFIADYAAAAGRPVPEGFDAFVVFSMFRLASIAAGVYRRGLDGNAADARALQWGERTKSIAERAWEIARSLQG